VPVLWAPGDKEAEGSSWPVRPDSSGRPQTSATPPCGAQTIAPSPECIQCLGCVYWGLTLFIFLATQVGIKKSGAQVNQTVWLFETQRVVTCWHEEFVMFGIEASRT